MNSFRTTICGLIAALALSGCAGQGQLTTSAQTSIANAKANVCPSLTAIELAAQTANVQLTATQQTVVNELNAACNGPNPTTVAQLTAYGASAAIVLVQLAEKKKS